MEKTATSIQYSNMDTKNIYNDPISTWTWMGLMISLLIPIMNIIMCIVLIVNVKNKGLVNFAKAGLVLGTISLCISLLIIFGII